MQLNVNMQSMTIEQVLALRHRNIADLADVVRRDLLLHLRIGDIPRRQESIAEQLIEIESEVDPNTFNTNKTFVQVTEALVAKLPRVGQQLDNLSQHRDQVFALAAVEWQSTSENMLGNAVVISGSWDGTIKTASRSVPTVKRMGSPVLALELLTGRQQVAVGMQDSTVALVSIENWTGRIKEKTMTLDGHTGPVCALAWLQNRGWLASAAEGVTVWQLSPTSSKDTPEIRWRVGMHDGAVRGMCWVHSNLSDQIWLALAPLHGQTTSLWDLQTSIQPAFTVRESVPEGSTVTSVIALNDARIATGTTSGSITAWDVAKTGMKLASNQNCHSLAVCALVATGREQLASASADASVKLWHLQRRQCHHLVHNSEMFELVLLAILEGHNGPVHAVAHLPKRGWLASGGSDGSVRLWRSALRKIEVTAMSHIGRGSTPSDHSEEAFLSHSATQNPNNYDCGHDAKVEPAIKSLCSFCGNKNIDTSSITCLFCGELLDEEINACEDVTRTNASLNLDMMDDVARLARDNGTSCSYCSTLNVGTSVTCVQCGELLL
eukprot:SAG31_NODE_396_length_16264_cov_17.206496_13_plen_551_part_00